jgi:hypothetical protein
MRLWLTVLTACREPADPGPGAIEITGYLDGGRVAWTWTGEEVLAAGLPGATSAGSRVELQAAGSTSETEATENGEFALSVSASLGEQVTLRVVGAPEEDVEHHDIVEPPAFPNHVHISATADPHLENRVSVEVQLDPAREDGRIWVVNHDQDSAVGLLDVFEHGALHGGHLHGQPADRLLLWFVPDDGPESAPVEAVVSPAS